MREAGGASADAAWVVIETPQAPDALAGFCRDLERLYRINPYLEFRAWQCLGPERHRAAFRNLSNGKAFDLGLSVERVSDRDFTVRYDRGIKRATHFEIEAATHGSRLKITDDYSGAGAAPDTAEVDRSLHAWGVALQQYLRSEARWGRCPLWRWYMRRVWVPMKPVARRITYILIVVTLAELALFALVIAIYWIESGRPR